MTALLAPANSTRVSVRTLFTDHVPLLIDGRPDEADVLIAVPPDAAVTLVVTPRTPAIDDVTRPPVKAETVRLVAVSRSPENVKSESSLSIPLAPANVTRPEVRLPNVPLVVVRLLTVNPRFEESPPVLAVSITTSPFVPPSSVIESVVPVPDVERRRRRDVAAAPP